MDIRNIINKKRNKQELSDDEIRYFIQKYHKAQFVKVEKFCFLKTIN